jgi:AraC-like DNA-binding protein
MNMEFSAIFCTIQSMQPPSFAFIYGTFIQKCAHRIHKNFEEYFTLQYMDSGSVEVEIDQEHYALNGQWFWSAWPGPVIGFHPAPANSTWVHRYVAFKGTLVEEWIREGLFPIRPQRAPGNTDFGSRFDRMLALFTRSDVWGKRRGIHAMEGILIELAEARERGDSGPGWLSDMARSLEKCMHKGPPDYEALAAAYDMSISTLRRQFKRATGFTPHDYFLSLKISAARRMLAETPLAIKEIARQLGYNDVFYFSRQFHALAGVSPAAYRRNAQG